MKYLVEATDKYVKEQISDRELSGKKGINSYKPKKGEQWEVDEDRKNLLVENGFVKVVEKEDKEKENKKEEKPLKKKRTISSKE